ncbi:MAG TPA: succinic semialdehyde dehydrogenase [Terriglobales bacterium]|nr:succinic semialdehyde dehydrogenase [Terriglobales bacterium]
MATEAQITAQRLAVLDPATGELLRELEVAGAQDVRAAVERARAAQPEWERLGVHRRTATLRAFQRRLYESKEAVAELISREAGKPVTEGLLTEVLVVLDTATFLMENAHELLRDEPIPHGNPVMKSKRAWLRREPYGVIGVISPWNYPFSTPAAEVLAALVAGNTVVLKPSEFTPLCALELHQLLLASGVPSDVLQVVVGEGPTGAALSASAVNKLIFTGSVATGKRVAQAAAQRLVPVVLELGGKDPMIVLDDADVEVVSSGAVWGAFVNSGQACLSVERCYVHRSIYEKFVQACVRKTESLRVGNGRDPETDVGPMIHQRQLQTVEAHIEEARARGARVLAGGRRLPELGPNFFAPTVIADVDHSMRLMREETFGPVLPLMPFDSDDEAVGLANDSEFGLAASVWTSNRARGEALAKRLQAGTVMVNDVLTCFGISEAPHGGMKASGIGRSHGRFGLEEMVQVKYVDSDLLPGLRKVWWFGYGAEFSQQMRGFVDLLFGHGLRRLSGGLRAVGAFFRKGRL